MDKNDRMSGRELCLSDSSLFVDDAEAYEKSTDNTKEKNLMLVNRSATKVNRDVFEASAGRLKVVGRAGVGIDNVDLAAATEHGCLVINAPTANTVVAAEHRIALLTAMARNIAQADASVKAGKWQRNKYVGVSLVGKTLAVMGFGKVGSDGGSDLLLELGVEVDSGSSDPFDHLESIPLMVQGVWSEDPAAQIEATTQFRKLLSIECSPPIDEVIKAGVVPRFVEFLGRQDLPQLQFEVAWALTNVASGTSEHIRVVNEHGAVPKFVLLLSSASDDVREQAVWALGNVAGDSPSCRDLVLGNGALMPLLAQLNEHSKLFMLRKATWTLSNFCRGKPPTPFEQVVRHLKAVSGLRINLSKSELILVGEVGRLPVLAVVLGCMVSALPVSYLGFPSGATYKAKGVWEGVVERVQRRGDSLGEASARFLVGARGVEGRSLDIMADLLSKGGGWFGGVKVGVV
ncbi:hypothetical protein HYC85_018330 [Camellia sinensis]|uniref:D-isomer specific 2-hydroxyacid dehydrogenase catalytic domain-containing protein n=1 Tax=Camellia sinensis TaxID=4442 RepID=A0A7J7GU10_CAMSI|nr:hypothetical protein HYC85_018330 [Camellia sinensis]